MEVEFPNKKIYEVQPRKLVKNMKNTKIIFIIVGILFVGGLGFFVINSKKGSSLGQASLVAGSGGAGESSGGSEAPKTDFLGTPSGSQALGSKTTKLAKTYSNVEFGFSFDYPEGLNISGFAEGETGYTILAQKSGSRESFQIFISEFDEPGPITPERIKQDLPDMVIDDPKPVILGSRASDGSLTSKKIEALIFFSQHTSLGRTREVWFVRNGKLFQITTYADMDKFVGPILDTLSFR